MARWLVVAVLLWLALLTALTLIALFRHHQTNHVGAPITALR